MSSNPVYDFIYTFFQRHLSTVNNLLWKVGSKKCKKKKANYDGYPIPLIYCALISYAGQIWTVLFGIQSRILP